MNNVLDLVSAAAALAFRLAKEGKLSEDMAMDVVYTLAETNLGKSQLPATSYKYDASRLAVATAAMAVKAN